jgi:hypothetical protein
MPSPHGWTPNQVKLRDKIAKKLETAGRVKEPYAVATSVVEKRMRVKREIKNGVEGEVNS